MANTRRGNLHYVDSTGTLTSDNIKVDRIILTATSANAVIALQDPSDSTVIMDLRVATSGQSEVFLLGALALPNGLKVSTLTNGIAMILYIGGSTK